MDHALWTEKYRPSEFSEVRGQAEIVKRVKSFVETKNLPHQLYAGPAGVGKSTLALVVAKQLFKENWHQNFLELNASDERGIDIVRHKVKDFARTRSIGNVPFKIIFLDESDALTREAQQALRRTMENYTTTCRFILSCNYSSKIIDPIQSRCAVFRFKPLSESEIYTLIKEIATKENIEIEESAEKALFEASEGDCRRLVTLLQSAASAGNAVTDQSIYEIASLARPKEIKEVLQLAVSQNFVEARKKLLDTMLSYGLSGVDIVKQIQKEILSLDIDNKAKMRLIDRCGEAEFRMVEGSDPYIQLEALLSQFMLTAV